MRAYENTHVRKNNVEGNAFLESDDEIQTSSSRTKTLMKETSVSMGVTCTRLTSPHIIVIIIVIIIIIVRA